MRRLADDMRKFAPSRRKPGMYFVLFYVQIGHMFNIYKLKKQNRRGIVGYP